jgi:hypothetical protein
METETKLPGDSTSNITSDDMFPSPCSPNRCAQVNQNNSGEREKMRERERERREWRNR